MEKEDIQVVGTKPIWNLASSDRLNKSESPIEIKAFVLFYIYLIWPDLVRDHCYNNFVFNPISNFKRDDNGRINTKFLPWNLACTNSDNLIKWFPLSIFPNGPGYDEQSHDLSVKLRCCLDNLVSDIFLKPDLILKKSVEFGIGFYSIHNNTNMRNVSQNVKGFIFNF